MNYDPADKRRIERLRQMLCQCRERNTRFQEKIEQLELVAVSDNPDHQRLVARIALLTNLVLELRRELADAKGTFAE